MAIIVIKQLATALAAVFLCLNVSAVTSVKIGGLSTHLSDGDYESFHRVFILSKDDYFSGYFLNSFGDDSFTVGKSFHTYDLGLKFSLHVGAVYGYRESSDCYKSDPGTGDKIICPMIAPEITAESLPLKPSVAFFGLDALVLTVNF